MSSDGQTWASEQQPLFTCLTILERSCLHQQDRNHQEPPPWATEQKKALYSPEWCVLSLAHLIWGTEP